MDRQERFQKIKLLLLNRGCVSLRTFMDEMEVSRATVRRDLEYLRDRMGTPIVWSADEQGYKLEPGFGPAGDVPQELPGVWFSEGEIRSLLTLHQLVKELDDGGVLQQHLQPVLERLYAMLGESREEAQRLMQRVRIVSVARRPVPAKWFRVFADALARQQQVRMTYRTRARQATTARTVSPQRLVHHRHTWYLDVWCQTKGELRRFALGGLKMHLPYTHETELVMDLLRHGPDVRVEAPAELRKKLQARLQAALGQY